MLNCNIFILCRLTVLSLCGFHRALLPLLLGSEVCFSLTVMKTPDLHIQPKYPFWGSVTERSCVSTAIALGLQTIHYRNKFQGQWKVSFGSLISGRALIFPFFAWNPTARPIHAEKLCRAGVCSLAAQAYNSDPIHNAHSWFRCSLTACVQDHTMLLLQWKLQKLATCWVFFLFLLLLPISSCATDMLLLCSHVRFPFLLISLLIPSSLS